MGTLPRNHLLRTEFKDNDSKLKRRISSLRDSMADFKEPLWREAWRQQAESTWVVYGSAFYQLVMAVVFVVWATLFKFGCCKRMHANSSSAHIQAKWARIKSCMGGETISDRTYFIVCICSVIFFTSGINGVLAIFLDVEGDPSENFLQPNFQVFMILTIVCSLIGMWPVWWTFYFCIFIKCFGMEKKNCDVDQDTEDRANRQRGLHLMGTAGFIVWSIFGFIAIGWSWKFAWESDFDIDVN